MLASSHRSVFNPWMVSHCPLWWIACVCRSHTSWTVVALCKKHIRNLHILEELTSHREWLLLFFQSAKQKSAVLVVLHLFSTYHPSIGVCCQETYAWGTIKVKLESFGPKKRKIDVGVERPQVTPRVDNTMASTLKLESRQSVPNQRNGWDPASPIPGRKCSPFAMPCTRFKTWSNAKNEKVLFCLCFLPWFLASPFAIASVRSLWQLQFNDVFLLPRYRLLKVPLRLATRPVISWGRGWHGR